MGLNKGALCTCIMQVRLRGCLVLLLAAALLSLAVPTLQQAAPSKSTDAATEAPFATGAKSVSSDASTPAAAAPAAATKAEQPAPAQATAATTPAKPGKKSKIVDVAPEAELQNEVDDIDVSGGRPRAAWGVSQQATGQQCHSDWGQLLLPLHA
jgi:septal ring-binding cell division protein DamX